MGRGAYESTRVRAYGNGPRVGAVPSYSRTFVRLGGGDGMSQARLDFLEKARMKGLTVAVIGLGYVGLPLAVCVRQPHLAPALFRAYNDWLAEHCAPNRERLLGV